VTDYTQDINNGTMMIRDTGTGWVEFWFITSAGTWNYQQNWHAYFDGAWHDYTFRMEKGGRWQQFGSTFLTEQQDVHFVIDDDGLGWPTSEIVGTIVRGRIAGPPVAPQLVSRTVDSIRVMLDWGFDNSGQDLGGLPVLESEIWASPDGTPRWVHNNTKDTTFSPLATRATYYFWGRMRNAAGWSPFGAVSAFATLGPPYAPTVPRVFALSQTSVSATLVDWGPANDLPVLETQIGYGLDPTTPQSFSPEGVLTGLQPAKQYYFWARVRNALGWGDWSARKDALLPAGAWVKLGGAWHRAIPWVKVGGVWKIAQPKTLVNAVWRNTG
jgi:hypothetical protein